MIAVASSIALFSQSITIVGADVLVYCDGSHEEAQGGYRDMPSRFGDSLPLQGLEVGEVVHFFPSSVLPLKHCVVFIVVFYLVLFI